MPSPFNISNIPAPRVEFIDPRTGLMAREWYRFFFNLFNLTGGGTNDTSLSDLQVGPPPINDVLGELGITYDQAQLASMMAQYEQSVRDVINQIETAPAMPQLGTLSAVNEDNVRLIGFATNPSPAVPDLAPVGTLYWSDDNATLEFSLEGGSTGQICQQLDFHPKNTGATQINKGMAVMATGVVGASTKITCARAVANGSVLAQYMLGIAAQDIPVNSFGYVVWFGSVRGFNTTGAIKTVPETWVDGDILYFDPVYPGELTKVEPNAPNLDLPIGIVTNAANNGAIFVRMKTGESMNELHDVNTSAATNNDLLQYYGPGSYWRNVAPSAVSVGTATNLSGGVAELSLGAVSTPSLTFTGDLNTGIWSPAADTLAASTAGAERLRITSAGNVGIGTAAPAEKLHLSGSGTQRLRITESGTGVFTQLVQTTTNTGLVAAAPAATDNYLTLSTTRLGTTLERMRIDSVGNVGIGTTTPGLTAVNGKELSVSSVAADTVSAISIQGNRPATGNTSAVLAFWNNTDRIAQINAIRGAGSNDGNIAIFTAAAGVLTERMRITNTGTVGIGTSTNLSTLTVNGSFASKSPSTVNAATYTVAATDGSLRFTTTDNTLTLPAPASFPGRILYLNTITANSVTSASANVIPLGSNTAGTAILAATAGKFAMLQSDGTNWITMLAN